MRRLEETGGGCCRCPGSRLAFSAPLIAARASGRYRARPRKASVPGVRWTRASAAAAEGPEENGKRRAFMWSTIAQRRYKASL